MPTRLHIHGLPHSVELTLPPLAAIVLALDSVMTSTIDHDRSQAGTTRRRHFTSWPRASASFRSTSIIQGRVHRAERRLASGDSRRRSDSTLASSAAERDALDNVLREEHNEIVCAGPSRSPGVEYGLGTLDVRVPADANQRWLMAARRASPNTGSDTTTKRPVCANGIAVAQPPDRVADRLPPRSYRAGIRRRRLVQ